MFQMGGGLDLTSPQLMRMLFPGGTFQCSMREFTELSTVILAKRNLAGMDAKAAAPSQATH